jgi:hypothetical protein
VNGEGLGSMKSDSARRRLLRGAFAVPAVLTLHSGGALAATSSRCQANTIQTNVNIVQTGLPSDTYLRYRLWKLGKEKDTGGVKVIVWTYWIVGSELNSLRVDNATPPKYLSFSSGFVPTPGAYKWQEINGDTGARINEVKSTDPSNGANAFSLSDKYVVLRLDSRGVVVGIGADTGGDLFVASCWASVGMTRA